MAHLSVSFCGIKAPNPFWLASAPPTDKAYNVERAFRAGWGGVVWKTLGEAGPPIVNVSGARYSAIHGPDRRPPPPAGRWPRITGAKAGFTSTARRRIAWCCST